MPELHLPWLELSVLLPLLGAPLVAFARSPGGARSMSVVVCSLTLFCAIGEWIDFALLQTFEARDHWDALKFLFPQGRLVIDELSAPLVPLSALLYLTVVLTTMRTKVDRFSFSLTLVSEAILLATLSCRTPWAIVILMILAVVPAWRELRMRGRSTRCFSIHMGAFALLAVAGQAMVDAGWLLAGGGLLTAAGLIRTGIVPLHCWMTDLFEKATFGTALLFVTPLTGAYLIMRMVLPIAPEWALQSIALLSLVTAVYAGAMALVQDEARRFFCYLLISHLSLVLVGLELATPIGLTGALCVWLSVGLSLGGFGLTLRCVESRVGRISMSRYHGLFDQMPTLASLFLLTGLASIGFPGTVGFIGIELLIDGAVGVYPLIGCAVVVATALDGIAVLSAFLKIFTGCRPNASICLRARPAERFAVLVLTLLIIGGGLYPQWGVHSRFHAAAALIEHRRANALNRPSEESSPTVAARSCAPSAVALSREPIADGSPSASSFPLAETLDDHGT